MRMHISTPFLYTNSFGYKENEAWSVPHSQNVTRMYARSRLNLFFIDYVLSTLRIQCPKAMNKIDRERKQGDGASLMQEGDHDVDIR